MGGQHHRDGEAGLIDWTELAEARAWFAREMPDGLVLRAFDALLDFPTDEMVRAIDLTVNHGPMLLSAAGIDLVLEAVRRVMFGPSGPAGPTGPSAPDTRVTDALLKACNENPGPCPHEGEGEGQWCYRCWTNVETGESYDNLGDQVLPGT